MGSTRSRAGRLLARPSPLLVRMPSHGRLSQGIFAVPRYLTFSNAHLCDDYLCFECYHERQRCELRFGPGSYYLYWQNCPPPGQGETDGARHSE
jgi:hypothetical protein